MDKKLGINFVKKISLVRQCMIPVFCIMFLLDGMIGNYTVAAILLALTIFTDFIDKEIARRKGIEINSETFRESFMGRVLVVLAMVLILTEKKWIFDFIKADTDVLYLIAIICVCLMVTKEFFVVARKEKDVFTKKGSLGYYTTLLQDISICLLILSADYFRLFGGILFWMGFSPFIIATAASLYLTACKLFKIKICSFTKKKGYKDKHHYEIMPHIWIFLALLFVLIPLYIMIITSLMSSRESQSSAFHWWPQSGLSFKAYTKLFSMRLGNTSFYKPFLIRC